LASWSRLHLFPLFLWFYWPADGAVEPSLVQHTFVSALRAADAVFHAVSTYGTELFFTGLHGITSKGFGITYIL
jgi:hypothetical protein